MVDHGCLKQSLRENGPRVLLWKTLSQTPRHKIWRSSLTRDNTWCWNGLDVIWGILPSISCESLFLLWDMLNEKEKVQTLQRSGPGSRVGDFPWGESLEVCCPCVEGWNCVRWNCRGPFLVQVRVCRRKAFWLPCYPSVAWILCRVLIACDHHFAALCMPFLCPPSFSMLFEDTSTFSLSLPPEINFEREDVSETVLYFFRLWVCH